MAEEVIFLVNEMGHGKERSHHASRLAWDVMFFFFFLTAFLRRSCDDGFHFVLAHVWRHGAVNLLYFRGRVGFAAAFDEDVALWDMLVFEVRRGRVSVLGDVP